MTLTTRPARDELEVSVFGPGLGECVVVHVGDDEWLIIDSCKDPDTGRPAGLQYLQALGVDIASRVKLVLVTHWHDDHMQGAAETLHAASRAAFSCSSALRRDEFATLIAGSEQLHMKSTSASGIDEFAEILRTLESRRPKGTRASAAGPRWATADRCLYQRNPEEGVSGCNVHALSPSDAAATRSFRGLAALMPELNGPKRATVSVEPNEVSVVLSVSFGGGHALLGADLETGKNLASGWHAIVASTTRPRNTAHIYKVAHHGSSNADHETIWSALLTDNPIAIVTPFLQGSVALPGTADVKRLRTRTLTLYVAGRPRATAPLVRDKAVERTIREVAKSLRPRTGRLGHVRVRLGASGEQRVELFGAALAL